MVAPGWRQCKTSAVCSWVLVDIPPLGRDTLATVKEHISLGLAHSCRSLVHYPHAAEHGSPQEGTTLEKERLHLHLGLQAAGTDSDLAWALETSVPTPSDTLVVPLPDD